jgi:hypothetical protein
MAARTTPLGENVDVRIDVVLGDPAVRYERAIRRRFAEARRS